MARGHRAHERDVPAALRGCHAGAVRGDQVLTRGIAAAAAFVALAVVVRAGAVHDLDRRIMDIFQSTAAFPLDVLASLLSAIGSLVLTIPVAIVLAGLWTRYSGIQGLAPLALGAVIGVGLLVGRVVGQEGPPPSTLRDFHWLALSVGDSSSTQAYPSGHVARTTFLALLTGARHPRFVPVAWVLTLSMAVSRIYVGSHWPSDVLGGLLLGAAAGAMTVATIELFRETPRQQPAT